jgi:hypothetical protein
LRPCRTRCSSREVLPIETTSGASTGSAVAKAVTVSDTCRNRIAGNIRDDPSRFRVGV